VTVRKWLAKEEKKEGKKKGREGKREGGREGGEALDFGRNPMGVLGGGGGGEGGREGGRAWGERGAKMVMDPNTGQLIPSSLPPSSSSSSSSAPSSSSSAAVKPPPPRSLLPLPHRGWMGGSQLSMASPSLSASKTKTRKGGRAGGRKRKKDDDENDRGGFRHRPPLLKGEGGREGGLPRPSEGNRLTALSIELHLNTRGELRPDPKEDGLVAVCFTVGREGGREGEVGGCA